MRSHLLQARSATVAPDRSCTRLEHDVYYVALDLDELDEVERRLRLFRRNRAGPAVVPGRRPPGPAGRRTCARPFLEHLRAEGVDPGGWRITLITNLRVFGYVFNPASFYLCRDADGVLRVVIVEVHNTHGERHLYTLRPRDGGRTRSRPRWTRSSTSRRSSRWRGGYTVRVRDEPARLRISINERPGRGPRSSHASLDLAPAAADRPERRCGCSSATRSSPSKTIGAHPLARAAALAARRPLPSASARPPDDAARPPLRRDPARRRDPTPRPRLALAGRPGRGRARSAIGRLTRRPARRVASRSSATGRRPSGARDPDPRPRGARRACSSAVRPAPARPTWTACGPAPTWRRCSSSRR